MRKRDVEIGGRYLCQVSGRVVTVRILREESYGGWTAKNEETGHNVRVRSPQRLRSRVS